jgi:hypothetical protein
MLPTTSPSDIFAILKGFEAGEAVIFNLSSCSLIAHFFQENRCEFNFATGKELQKITCFAFIAINS